MPRLCWTVIGLVIASIFAVVVRNDWSIVYGPEKKAEISTGYFSPQEIHTHQKGLMVGISSTLDEHSDLIDLINISMRSLDENRESRYRYIYFVSIDWSLLTILPKIKKELTFAANKYNFGIVPMISPHYHDVSRSLDFSSRASFSAGAAFICAVKPKAIFSNQNWTSQFANTIREHEIPWIGFVESNLMFFMSRRHFEVFDGLYYPTMLLPYEYNDWLRGVYSKSLYNESSYLWFQVLRGKQVIEQWVSHNGRSQRGTVPLFSKSQEASLQLMIGIAIKDRLGYVQFTGRMLRKMHRFPERDIFLFDDGSTNIFPYQLRAWFGERANVVQSFEGTKGYGAAVNTWRMNVFFSESPYDALLTLDSDLVLALGFLEVIEHYLHMTDGFFSLFHTSAAHHPTVNCDIVYEGMCEKKSTIGNAGVVMTKSLVVEILNASLKIQDNGSDSFDWQWSTLLKEIGVRKFVPKVSEALHIGRWGSNSGRGSEMVQGECSGDMDQAVDFPLGLVDDWVRGGISFYLDQCHLPDDPYVLKHSIARKLYLPSYAIKDEFVRDLRLLHPGWGVMIVTAEESTRVTHRVLSSLANSGTGTVSWSLVKFMKRMKKCSLPVQLRLSSLFYLYDSGGFWMEPMFMFPSLEEILLEHPSKDDFMHIFIGSDSDHHADKFPSIGATRGSPYILKCIELLVNGIRGSVLAPNSRLLQVAHENTCFDCAATIMKVLEPIELSSFSSFDLNFHRPEFNLWKDITNRTAGALVQSALLQYSG